MNKTEIDYRRIRHLNQKPVKDGQVLYWMSRDQRINDNWALLYAQKLAFDYQKPLSVVFCLAPQFLGAILRQYNFMIEGLKELESGFNRLNINFYLLTGQPEETLPRFCNRRQVGVLVSDFSPLRISRQWKKNVTESLNCASIEVDAHNLVPCWYASPKQEYAAYTFRPKIKKHISGFLGPFPEIIKHPFLLPEKAKKTDWLKIKDKIKAVNSEYGSNSFQTGENAAHKAMEKFIIYKLDRYERDRNDPNLSGQSDLSPYLHFGQLSAQRLAYEVQRAEEPGIDVSSFLEELIVRRELSDNFCYFNQAYDSIHGFPKWAKESLEAHAEDPREYIYRVDEFESAATHDPLWNAAQKEMLVKGKMHGYMRMYWAKKILEWSETVEEALRTAIYLNDKFSLDGRDPNGYTGIAWSIGGVHDRAWANRPVFGKIRYMSYKGSRSKFDISTYIKLVDSLNS